MTNRSNNIRFFVCISCYFLAGQFAVFFVPDQVHDSLSTAIAMRVLRDVGIVFGALSALFLTSHLLRDRARKFSALGPIAIYLLIGGLASPSELLPSSIAFMGSMLQVVALIVTLRSMDLEFPYLARSVGHAPKPFDLQALLTSGDQPTSHCLAYGRRYERPVSALLLRLRATAAGMLEVGNSDVDADDNPGMPERWVRETDLVVRTGDRNECLILCPETPIADLENLVDRLKTRLERPGLGLTYSFGSFPNDAYTVDSLIDVLRQKICIKLMT